VSDVWRTDARMPTKEQPLSVVRIRKGMGIVGSDGGDMGAVDRVTGRLFRLARENAAEEWPDREGRNRKSEFHPWCRPHGERTTHEKTAMTSAHIRPRLLWLRFVKESGVGC
jgi:hypothetical protein